MTSLSEIARDPHKALKNLEKSLGVGEGTLMREMQQLADEIGDWTQHIPYTLAAGYYDDGKVRERYQPHVDGCAYCQRLLESLHPTDLQAAAFVRDATRANRREPSRFWRGRSFPIAVVVSTLATAFASLFFVPQLQSAGVIKTPGDASSRMASIIMIDHPVPTRIVLADELRKRPNRLSELELSNRPAERFLAAKYYFAADKPELAYQQIGEGLELAGLQPDDAQKITSVADLPSDKTAAADIANAAQQLPHLQANAQPGDPTDFLQVARAQAKLGLHRDALASIQRYLQTQHVDPKTLADFSSVATPKPLLSEPEPRSAR
jgi:hypothetical protein